VTATRSGAAANTATVVSGTPDPDPSNNQSTTTVDSAPSADLGIAKHASETAPLVGESFTYRLEVANRGPSTATGVVVADRIPAGLRVDAVHSSQGSCTGVRTVVCELGSLRDGATATVRIVVTALREGPMSNGASVTSEPP